MRHGKQGAVMLRFPRNPTLSARDTVKSIDRLHQVMVAIPTGEKAETRAFYGTALGLREPMKPEPLQSRSGIWFLACNIQLHQRIVRFRCLK